MKIKKSTKEQAELQHEFKVNRFLWQFAGDYMIAKKGNALDKFWPQLPSILKKYDTINPAGRRSPPVLAANAASSIKATSGDVQRTAVKTPAMKNVPPSLPPAKPIAPPPPSSAIPPNVPRASVAPSKPPKVTSAIHVPAAPSSALPRPAGTPSALPPRVQPKNDKQSAIAPPPTEAEAGPSRPRDRTLSAIGGSDSSYSSPLTSPTLQKTLKEQGYNPTIIKAVRPNLKRPREEESSGESDAEFLPTIHVKGKTKSTVKHDGPGKSKK